LQYKKSNYPVQIQGIKGGIAINEYDANGELILALDPGGNATKYMKK